LKKIILIFFTLVSVSFATEWNPSLQLNMIKDCQNWAEKSFKPVQKKKSVWNLSHQKYYDYLKACRKFVTPFQFSKINYTDFKKYFNILQRDQELKNKKNEDLIVLFVSKDPTGAGNPPPSSNGYPLTLIPKDTNSTIIDKLKSHVLSGDMTILEKIQNKRTGELSIFYFSHIDNFKTVKNAWLKALKNSETTNKKYGKPRG